MLTTFDCASHNLIFIDTLEFLWHASGAVSTFCSLADPLKAGIAIFKAVIRRSRA